jgi:hypothetical protein
MSDEQALAVADAAFSGTLVEIIPPAVPSGSSGAPERFVFEVDEVFKGDVRARQTVVTYAGGATCGLELSGLGPFLVFASTDSPIELGVEDGELSSNLCSGSRAFAGGDRPEGFGRSSPPEGEVAAPSDHAGAADQDDAGSVDAGPAIGLTIVVIAAAVAAVVLHRRAS